MSIDPLTEDYNYQSPYNFSENRVIDGIELEGLEHISHTVYQVHQDSDGNYNSTYQTSYTRRDVGDWSGTKSQNQYHVYNNDGIVTAIHSGDNSLSSLNNSGISISSTQGRAVSVDDIIEGAKNNKEFQKAGETLANVGTTAGVVLSLGGMAGASLVVRGVLVADAVTGVDDLSGVVTQDGKTVMEKTIGSDATSSIKTVVNTANAVNGGFDAVGAYKVGQKVNAATDATGVVIDASSAKENAQKVIKNDNDKK